MTKQGWRFNNALFISEPQVSSLADLYYINSKELYCTCSLKSDKKKKPKQSTTLTCRGSVLTNGDFFFLLSKIVFYYSAE